MFKRAIGLATAAAIALGTASALAFATPAEPVNANGAPASTVEDTNSIPPVTAPSDTATDSPSTEATVAPKPKPKYAPKPYIKKGHSKSHVQNVMKKSGFRVTFKYTYGKKNRVVKMSVPKQYTKSPYRKYNKAKKRYEYKENVRFVVYLGNGKSKPHKWKTGTATWYSIADNTPRGSRATSSGKPLGSYGGWTFASTKFPLGTKLKVKGPNGKIQTVICTDRGGLHTIDLYKPASDRLGMNGKSKFKYVVVGKAF